MDEHGGIRDHEDAIRALRAGFVAALRDGDAAAAAAADDARLLPPSTEPLKGREAITAFWRAGVEAGIADGLAYEIGRDAMRLQPAGGAMVVDRGSYVLVHARQTDGSWRRAVEMFSPKAPPARAGDAQATTRRQEEP